MQNIRQTSIFCLLLLCLGSCSEGYTLPQPDEPQTDTANSGIIFDIDIDMEEEEETIYYKNRQPLPHGIGCPDRIKLIPDSQ